MKRKLIQALLVTSLCLGSFAQSFARVASGITAAPVIIDEGDKEQPWKAVVSSVVAVIQPYLVDLDKNRVVRIQNPSANYSLMVGTWSGFTEGDNWWFVNPASGSVNLSNNTTHYFRYGSGASSETVRGAVFKQ